MEGETLWHGESPILVATVPHAGQRRWKVLLYLHSPCLRICIILQRAHSPNLSVTVSWHSKNDTIIKISNDVKMGFRSSCRSSACTGKNCLHVPDVLLLHWGLVRFYFGFELNVFPTWFLPTLCISSTEGFSPSPQLWKEVEEVYLSVWLFSCS